MSENSANNTFPQSVIDMMKAGGSTVTCLPVKIEDDESTDIALLEKQESAFSVGLETDLIEHENASVVLLRVQMFTRPDNPLVGEVLITPGGAETHYEILTLLSAQQSLTWFLSDQDFNTIHQQRQPLNDQWRDEFLALRDEAFKRDSLIRLAGKYSAQTAFAEVVSHYALRN